MKAEDFLYTAKSMCNSSKEWDVRTSMSRSYYAVYLHIRDFITTNYSNGRDFPKDKHNSVGRCFGRCSEKEWKKVHMAFNTLHQSRTDADYKLHKTFTAQNSNIALTLAKKILSDYQSCLSDSKLASNYEVSVKQEFHLGHGVNI